MFLDTRAGRSLQYTSRRRSSADLLRDPWIVAAFR
jgi:hypothetical protein